MGRSGGHSSGGHHSSSSHRSSSSSHRSSSSSFSSSSRRSSSFSSSGRSSSSGRTGGSSHSSYSSSSHSNYGGSPHHTTHHNPPPPPPHNHYGGYNNYNRGYGYNGGYRSGRYTYRGNTYYGGPVTAISKLFSTIVIIIILIACLRACGGIASINSFNNDSYSYTERTKYAGTVYVSDYYINDDVLYSDEESTVNKGLKHFYEKTGVCLFLEFHEGLDDELGANYTDAMAQDYAYTQYDNLFQDEGHILYVVDVHGDNSFDVNVTYGLETGTTIDAEAQKILQDYIIAASNSTPDDYANIFGTAISEAADRIMYHKTSAAEKLRPVLIVLIVGIVLIVIITIFKKWWEAKQRAKAEEDARLQQILQTPLQTYGDSGSSASSQSAAPTSSYSSTSATSQSTSTNMSSSTGASNTSYGSPTNTYGSTTGNDSYNSTSNGYGTPNNGYGTPNNGYGSNAGNNSYNSTSNGYGTPNNGYGTPNNGYPNNGYPNNGYPNNGYPNNGNPNGSNPNGGNPGSYQ